MKDLILNSRYFMPMVSDHFSSFNNSRSNVSWESQNLRMRKTRADGFGESDSENDLGLILWRRGDLWWK